MHRGCLCSSFLTFARLGSPAQKRLPPHSCPAATCALDARAGAPCRLWAWLRGCGSSAPRCRPQSRRSRCRTGTRCVRADGRVGGVVLGPIEAPSRVSAPPPHQLAQIARTLWAGMAGPPTFVCTGFCSVPTMCVPYVLALVCRALTGSQHRHHGAHHHSGPVLPGHLHLRGQWRGAGG